MKRSLYEHTLPAPLNSFYGEAAIVLGSGLGYLTDSFSQSTTFDYRDIPGFPESTVEGHSGQLVTGTLAGRKVVGLRGRFHYYEGHSVDDVTAPVRLLAHMKIPNLIITNASGAINCAFSPGEIVAVTDYMNFGFRSTLPLAGHGKESAATIRGNPVDLDWLERTTKRLHREGIELKKGTYVWVLGPTYETPAEIRAFQKAGGDMVGMSTVPEISAAVQLGMRVLVFSCITNYASGMTPEKLSHQEVVSAANKARQSFSYIVRTALESI